MYWEGEDEIIEIIQRLGLDNIIFDKELSEGERANALTRRIVDHLKARFEPWSWSWGATRGACEDRWQCDDQAVEEAAVHGCRRPYIQKWVSLEGCEFLEAQQRAKLADSLLKEAQRKARREFRDISEPLTLAPGAEEALAGFIELWAYFYVQPTTNLYRKVGKPIRFTK